LADASFGSLEIFQHEPRLSDVTFNQLTALWSNNYDIYGQVSFGCHGQCVNKLNNARRIF